MNIYEKLVAIQSKLKAPKGQYNKFGNYNYRSCEDILEAVKPLLVEHKVAMFIGDEIIQLSDRYYIKAKVKLVNAEKPQEEIETTALAREAIDRKGMDDSQITGTASSYARKYCLNGLFAIDDTKDADTDQDKKDLDNRPNYNNNQKKQETDNTQFITEAQRKLLFARSKQYGMNKEAVSELIGRYGYESTGDIQKSDFNKILNEMEA